MIGIINQRNITCVEPQRHPAGALIHANNICSAYVITAAKLIYRLEIVAFLQ